MSFNEWANSRGEDRYMDLIEDIRDIYTDVADFNLDEQCKSSDLRAEIVE
jgi:hypothetical protein